jgi:hypothetical protein
MFKSNRFHVVAGVALLTAGLSVPAGAEAPEGEIDIVVATQANGEFRVQTLEVKSTQLDSKLESIRERRDVVAAEVDGKWQKFADPLEHFQYYLDRPTLANGFHSAPSQGNAANLPTIKVAVVDTGVNSAHPSLNGVVLPGADFVGATDGRIDPDGHGTFVASIIASPANDGVGIAGVAPGVKILPVRSLDLDGGSFSQIAQGIAWADASGADVINLSLGGSTNSAVVRSAIERAIANGRVVIAATGNEGWGAPQYPAAYPDVIAVGSVDSLGRPSGFSNFGEHVHVVAPGEGILAATYGSASSPCTDYCYGTGTSFSAPIVSGLAAWIRATRVGMSPAAVKALLQVTASDVTSAGSGWDATTGWGLVNPASALSALSTPTNTAWYQEVFDRYQANRVRGVAANPNRGAYVLDRTGRVASWFGAPLFGSADFGIDGARDIAVMPDGLGYIILDLFGGVHMFGSARALRGLGNPYWVGWDIGRAVDVMPDGKGYVILDGWGGLHSYGSAAANPPRSLYWPGWDIARDVSIASNGEVYVLDGWGGVHGGHPASAAVQNQCGNPYWPGWDVARRIQAFPGGYTVLDGLGGISGYCNAPPPPRSSFLYSAFSFMGFAYSPNYGWMAASFNGTIRNA